MPKSSTADIRLRGTYIPLTPSKYKKVNILKYRKPLTSSLRKRFKIQSFDFKHYYTSGNEVLLDFERYIRKYSIKSKKSATQTTLDVRSI